MRVLYQTITTYILILSCSYEYGTKRTSPLGLTVSFTHEGLAPLCTHCAVAIATFLCTMCASTRSDFLIGTFRRNFLLNNKELLATLSRSSGNAVQIPFREMRIPTECFFNRNIPEEFPILKKLLFIIYDRSFL